MKRIIFLVDMNAFYISCEMSRNPELKGKPAVVAGDPKKRTGIVLTANYEARKYGIKTTMLVHQARELCPDVIFVPPDHDFYRRKSKEVMGILSSYSPIIEQNSIDEAWMDLTGCCPLFGGPLDIAEKIMNDIKGELDLWCSIGISENKFLAKMASEMKKPLGITEIWKEDVGDKIWPLPVRAMYGIGKQTEKKLLSLGINKIGDIAKCDRMLLYNVFGKYGYDIYNLANGIDNSPVVSHTKTESKSISRSITLPEDTCDIEYAKVVLLEMCEEVGAEARKYGYKGRTVSITLKYGDFQAITRQRSISPTYLTKEIYETGKILLEQNWNSNRPIRLIGVGLANFEGESVEQISLFDLCNGKDKKDKEEKLERVMDKIREKYGADKIRRAKVLKGIDC